MRSLPPLRPPDLLSERQVSALGRVGYAVALILLATWDLGGRSIFHRDLPRFATIAREMIRSGDWLVPTQYGEVYANKPILYVWLIALPSALVGDPTAFLMRLPSALALVATALATSAWGFARTGSRRAGYLAGGLLATTFFVHELGRVGRPDMLATAGSTVAAALLDRAILGKGNRRDAWLIGIALGVGLLSKGPVALLVPAVVVAWPRAGVAVRERLARARLLVALGVAVAMAACWFVPAWIRGGDEFARRLVVDQVKERVAGKGNHIEAWWHYVVELPAAAVPWWPLFLVAGLVFVRRKTRERLGDAAHVGAAIVAFLVLSAVPTKETRYAAILIPPLAVASAQWLLDLARRPTREGKWARHLLVLGVICTLLSVGAVVPMVRWSSTIPWVLPPALVLAACGLATALRSRELADPALVGAGRLAGLSVLLVACGLCVYWSVLARYLVVRADVENAAVAAVLSPDVPTVILGGGVERALNNDELYVGAPRASYAKAASALPSSASVPRLLVVCLAEQVESASVARGQPATEVLRRARTNGTTLVVLRFGA